MEDGGLGGLLPALLAAGEAPPSSSLPNPIERYCSCIAAVPSGRSQLGSCSHQLPVRQGGALAHCSSARAGMLMSVAACPVNKYLQVFPVCAACACMLGDGSTA